MPLAAAGEAAPLTLRRALPQGRVLRYAVGLRLRFAFRRASTVIEAPRGRLHVAAPAPSRRAGAVACCCVSQTSARLSFGALPAVPPSLCFCRLQHWGLQAAGAPRRKRPWPLVRGSFFTRCSFRRQCKECASASGGRSPRTGSLRLAGTDTRGTGFAVRSPCRSFAAWLLLLGAWLPEQCPTVCQGRSYDTSTVRPVRTYTVGSVKIPCCTGVWQDTAVARALVAPRASQASRDVRVPCRGCCRRSRGDGFGTQIQHLPHRHGSRQARQD